MKTHSRKTKINLALKVAIIRSGKSSRRVAQSARMGEVRLSAIVHGRVAPTEKERATIARVLDMLVADIFPTDGEALAS